MSELNNAIIPLITFLPLFGVFLILFVDKEKQTMTRLIGFLTAAVNFVLSLHLFFHFDPHATGMQFETKVLDRTGGLIQERIPEWIPGLVKYHVGVDGISLFLVLLTTFLVPIVLLASWTDIKHRVKEYVISMLLLETALVGVFVALDLILFYVFWELVLIPMYLLIGVWGSHQKKNFFGIEIEGRIYSAVKFFIYTMVGSLLMLVAIIALYFQVSPRTFDLVELQTALRHTPLLASVQMWLFAAFALAFAIKVPMFPFHTWLPDAHVDAPTGGSVILAGVLLKMGTYGFLRFCLPLFPDAAGVFMPFICLLAVVGIIYGALVALAQPDMKKLVAYSSVSHLGFVMLGLFVYKSSLEGMAGAVLQMVNHGLSTGGLFLAVGVIYERRHTRLIRDFGGLTAVMPMFFVCFLILTLSSIGLPGLNGFVGEILVLQGAMKHNFWYCAFAATGVILGAIYMLRTFRSVMYGPLDKEENRKLPDLRPHELGAFVPLILAMFLIGLYPKPFLEKIEPSLKQVRSAIVSTSNPSGGAIVLSQTGLRCHFVSSLSSLEEGNSPAHHTIR
ncbi:MAG: NADH-quinone oxidoreductase subunit M [Abditibacteriales bacterium]|nr:NADH-quinone oxidoreductase subunit M [Abditibacteriales bacterium]MDW8364581.1 NADH-quinone oxidoreductase subunit M [Abditibacteriales bacterium]